MKSRIQEAKDSIDEEEELTEEEKQALMKALSGMGSKGTLLIKKFSIFPLIYCIGILLRIIPNFTHDLYKEFHPFEQPFSAFVVSKIPGSSDFTAPIIFLLVAAMILRANGNIPTALAVPLTMMLTESTYSYASQNIVVTVCLILMMLSLVTSQFLLTHDPYSFKWFLIYALSMVLTLFPLYVSINYLGLAIASYIACFISSFSRIGAVTGSKPKIVWEFMLLTFTSYIVLLPVILIYLKTRSDEGANQINRYYVSLEDYVYETKKHFQPVEITVIAISLLMIKFGKYRYVSLVPIIQLFIGCLATVLIPYETPGDAVASRAFLVRLMLMMTAGIIISANKNDLINTGAPIAMVTIALILRVASFAA